MKKYLRVFQMNYHSASVFQLSFFLSFLAIPIQLVVTYFFWNGILPSGGSISSKEMVSYFLYVDILQLGFSPAMYVTHNLWGKINQGTLLVWLNRPISFPFMTFFESLSEHLMRTYFPLLAVAILGTFLGEIFSLPTFIFGIVSAFLGFILLFEIQFVIGCLTFWLKNVLVVRDVLMSILFILGGLVIPIDLTPQFIQKIASFTPIPSVYYFPARLLAGQLEIKEIIENFFLKLFWCAGFAGVIYILWKQGTRDKVTYGA